MLRKRNISSQRPIFQFRLRHGVSIGPGPLKHIWSVASGSGDVTVSRELRRINDERSQHVYCLSGPPNLIDLPAIESKLRQMLQAALIDAHIDLIRLP